MTEEDQLTVLVAQYTVIWRGTTPQLFVTLVQSAVLYINIGIPPYLKSSNYIASCPLLPSTLQHNAPCSEICNLSNEHVYEHVVIKNRAVIFRSIHWSIFHTTVILYSTCAATDRWVTGSNSNKLLNILLLDLVGVVH